MITTLIDKQDTFEIVLDQIVSILLLEISNQQALAIAEAKDPLLWKLRIFKERYNPWEQYLNDQTDTTPIVNVWFDNETFDKNKGDVVERQQADGIFNIDCYGLGISSDVSGGGHNPGDRESAFEVHRSVRLVRNILMSSIYVNLLLKGLVSLRWPLSITTFQPELNGNPVHNILAERIAFNVTYNEFSPQFEHETLELLSATIKRVEDGEIIIEADYDFT